MKCVSVLIIFQKNEMCLRRLLIREFFKFIIESRGKIQSQPKEDF